MNHATMHTIMGRDSDRIDYITTHDGYVKGMLVTWRIFEHEIGKASVIGEVIRRNDGSIILTRFMQR